MSLARWPLLALALLAAPAALAKAPPPADPLDAALDAAGLRAEQLGFAPHPTWLRYPDPRQVPYANRLFSDLMAEPRRIAPTLRLVARAAGDFLDPRYRAKKPDGLFRAAYFAGWDLRLSAHRDYTAGLEDDLDTAAGADDPLVQAVARLYADLGRPFDLHGMDKPADFPKRRDDARAAAAALDPELRALVARGVLGLADALRWHRLAFRNVNGQAMLAAWPLRDLTATQFDGMEYFAQLDDIAHGVDEWALNTSSRKAIAAAEKLGAALAAWAAATKVDLGAQALDLDTPAGRIVVTGPGASAHDARGVLLAVDLGGNDTWDGPAGAATLDQPVSVVVDLAGDDAYVATGRTPAQGSGILGTGVLLDVAGNDTYRAWGSSQGYGMFGTGLLADLAGDDRYVLDNEGQGAAEFGVGLLFDLGGKDNYSIVSAGQGFGGAGNGIGTLVDLAGDDIYIAEPDSAKAFRPDYHSGGKVNYSYAQGAGAGRRGDLMDGHSWAGGIGTLLDLAGNDTYRSGNWAAGSGYWYGTGWLYDAAGDDTYSSSVFSLAAGAHFCIGVLLDEAGNDRYEGYGDAHTGMGFGHDFTIALLYDGGGDDRYTYGADGFGYAINASLAAFIDAGGNDRYQLDKGKDGFGFTGFKAEDLRPVPTRNYVSEPVQLGLFLDAGGRDEYVERDTASGTIAPSSTRRDGATIVRPKGAVQTTGGHDAGIFRDDARGRAIAWFAPRVSAAPLP